MKNGKSFECGYDKYKKVLFGLEEIFRITRLSLFETVLFTYIGDGLFEISVFNVQCIEKPLMDDYILSGINLSFSINWRM